ncbi:MAG: DUF2946 family protein [Sulfuritalea sp.]|nr:DUF2946 family protein [Sulfuritalea sp.]
MHPSAHLPWLRHRAAWLLACGLFAMAMQALGGNGLMRQHSVAGGFYAEICTAAGLSKVDPARQSGSTSLPDSAHSDCCKLCAASSPLLAGDAVLGVPPAPTFRSVLFASPFSHSSAFSRLSPPPRGPPTA